VTGHYSTRRSGRAAQRSGEMIPVLVAVGRNIRNAAATRGHRWYIDVRAGSFSLPIDGVLDARRYGAIFVTMSTILFHASNSVPGRFSVCGKFPEASNSSSICLEAPARIFSTSLNTHSPIRRFLGSSSQSETDGSCANSESHKLKSILLAHLLYCLIQSRMSGALMLTNCSIFWPWINFRFCPHRVALLAWHFVFEMSHCSSSICFDV
jgi:hypothetical protein